MANISLSFNDLSDQQLRDVFEIAEESFTDNVDDSPNDTEEEKPFNEPEHLSPHEQARHWEIMAGHSQYVHRYLRDRSGFYQGETKKLKDKIESMVKRYQGLLMQDGYNNSDLAEHWNELQMHYESMKGFLYHWNRALDEYTKNIEERFEELEESFEELSDLTNTRPETQSQAVEKDFTG